MEKPHNGHGGGQEEALGKRRAHGGLEPHDDWRAPARGCVLEGREALWAGNFGVGPKLFGKRWPP